MNYKCDEASSENFNLYDTNLSGQIVEFVGSTGPHALPNDTRISFFLAWLIKTLGVITSQIK